MVMIATAMPAQIRPYSIVGPTGLVLEETLGCLSIKTPSCWWSVLWRMRPFNGTKWNAKTQPDGGLPEVIAEQELTRVECGGSVSRLFAPWD